MGGCCSKKASAPTGTEASNTEPKQQQKDKDPLIPTTTTSTSSDDRPEKEVGLWSVPEVQQWLRSLRLDQYQKAAADNKVDGARLDAVKHSDEFEKLLGVTNAIHRKKLKANVRYYDTLTPSNVKITAKPKPAAKPSTGSAGAAGSTTGSSGSGGGIKFADESVSDAIARARSSTVPVGGASVGLAGRKALATAVVYDPTDYKSRLLNAKAHAAGTHDAAAHADANGDEDGDSFEVPTGGGRARSGTKAPSKGAAAAAAVAPTPVTALDTKGLQITRERVLALPEHETETLEDRIAIIVTVMTDPTSTNEAVADDSAQISYNRLVSIVECKNPALPSRKHIEAEAKDVSEQGQTAAAMTAVLNEVAKSAPAEFAQIEDAVKSWIEKYLTHSS